MTRILFVRHGETEWNRSGRWQGHADVPLSNEGRNQARQLAARLKRDGRRFDGIYASDLGRALETAQIVALELGLDVHPLVELREMHVGAWSGLTAEEIRVRFPQEWKLAEQGDDFRRGGHGETLANFQARIVRAVERLADAHPGQQLLVATHGGAIRVLLYHIAKLTGRSDVGHIANASITEVLYEDGSARLVSVNDVEHLDASAPYNMQAGA